MKFSKMMKIEIWKLFYSKIIWISLLIEIVAIVLSQVNVKEILKLENVIISPYIGISLTFRYIYLTLSLICFRKIWMIALSIPM